MAEHPWILLHTDPPLTTLACKLTPSRNRRLTFTRDATVQKRIASENKRDKLLDSGTADSDNNSSSSSSKFEEDSGLVDALAVAVSCMNITDTKRIRLCHPVPPTSISHDCSSNIEPNLCTAF